MWGLTVIATAYLSSWLVTPSTTQTIKNLIIDTDLYSDVDDAGALLLAATSLHVNLLGVNINVASSYSALAASAILAHYGKPFAEVPVGIKRPLTNDTFFDSWDFELGEYASKVAYHYCKLERGSLAWGGADEAWDPVMMYRKLLADAEDGSVTIASIGFFENLSGLLNSTADHVSPLTGPDLVAAKVTELVVMGGQYPSGREFNFWGDDPTLTAHVVNTWPGQMTFSGFEMGEQVLTGRELMSHGPLDDPVRRAYVWYTYGQPRASWDPLTVLYAMNGLGDVFEYGNEFGYNYVHPNGSNEWIDDDTVTNQHFLKLKKSRYWRLNYTKLAPFTPMDWTEIQMASGEATRATTAAASSGAPSL
ncbi:inosine/uridine-preferring nucleoside hydrolase [Xylariaceae sp. FL1019]|nr:inosine/uridine-preferring nucleoside hydrolase [Xylariaceae sp. FL1019]